MPILEEREYFPECSQSNLPLDIYCDKEKKFGRFIEDGKAYLIEDRNTPRPWLLFLPNDKVFSCVSNTGRGFFRHSKGYNITKQWEHIYYHTHTPPGERKIVICDNGVEKSFFDDSENFTATVRPGSIKFYGELGTLKVTVTIFVPENIQCECWNIKIENQGLPREIKVKLQQDWYFSFLEGHSQDPIVTQINGNIISASKCGMKGIFATSAKFSGSCKEHTETRKDGLEVTLSKATLTGCLDISSEAQLNVVLGAYPEDEEDTEILKCLDEERRSSEFLNIDLKWNKIFERNYCSLPDKNAEYFLNFWLKNQVYLTYRYDRGNLWVGYRDGFQDSWGYLLVEPEKAKDKIVKTLSYMLPDGRCPRQYYKFGDEHHDMRDFSDSIIWVADALVGYIKETGDYDVLDIKIPFLNGDEITSVEEHVFRGLESLYLRRGKNGLIKMRDGDWFDGLGGINKYGDDATSVWNTIATFYAQNVMAELYDNIGETEKAKLLRSRSAEYKKVVNEVGWDGNWYAYGYFEDGEPIGSSKNYEGKIYINPQTWAIFSGIVDSEDKIRRMEKAINRYLQTPFGPLLNYPPYALYGGRCGRVQRQRPGTFGNGAVYNHAAGFKVFADVARGDYDDALDTFSRAIPNHTDNSDSCRTSEPYAIGNVYYGPNHPRFGMNLFTWFTATPSWLIHGGFEEILGVKADFNGLKITPHVPVDWNEYKVSKIWRGSKYNISFEKTEEEKGIWIDGVRASGNIVKTDKKECNVTVKF